MDKDKKSDNIIDSNIKISKMDKDKKSDNIIDSNIKISKMDKDKKSDNIVDSNIKISKMDKDKKSDNIVDSNIKISKMDKDKKSDNIVDSYIKTSVKLVKKISNHLEKDLSPILEPIEDYFKHYIQLFIKNILPQNLENPYKKYKYLICLIHILHIIGIFLIISFGFFLPYQLQIYISIFYIFIMISWIIFGRCILIILTNYLGGTNDDYLFPFRWQTMFTICIFLAIISFIFYLFPIITPFNILMIINNYSKNFTAKLFLA